MKNMSLKTSLNSSCKRKAYKFIKKDLDTGVFLNTFLIELLGWLLLEFLCFQTY